MASTVDIHCLPRVSLVFFNHVLLFHICIKDFWSSFLTLVCVYIYIYMYVGMDTCMYVCMCTYMRKW